MRARINTLAAVAFALSPTACDDPLEPIALVQDLRVLGARVEVEGDAARAAPAPGEAARVRWLAVSPRSPSSVGWAFAACLSAPTNVGTPRCAEPPFARLASEAPSSEEPVFPFVLPAHLDPEKTPRVAVLGSICDGALPLGEPAESDCPRGLGGTRVSLELELSRAADSNHNPSFEEPALLLGDEVWAFRASSEEPCAGTELPQIAAGTDARVITIRTTAASREPVPRESELDPEREGLLVSHFTTSGELDRAFSTIAPDANSTWVTVAWKPPRTAPPDGQLVRFWFVVRDLRGGGDFTERAACVVP